MILKDKEITVEVRNNISDVSTMSQPDPNWTFTDRYNHTHRWVKDKRGSMVLPTCRRAKTREYWCCDCGDMHSDWEWRCRKCGETIKPGYRSSMWRDFIVTSTDYLINGEYATKEEAQAAIKRITSANRPS